MHFHLPKPLHGWRQFVGEVGIIVLGILIALGAEQIVQTLRLRSEARDFREAVDHELALNFGAFQFNQLQKECTCGPGVIPAASNARNPPEPAVRLPLQTFPPGRRLWKIALERGYDVHDRAACANAT
jgi:hypothetical protein